MPIANFMTDSCTIETEQQTKSLTGGAQIAWTVRANNVRCRCGSLSSGNASVYGASFDLNGAYRVYFDTEQNLTVKDRLVFGSNKFQVVAVNNVQRINRLWQVDVLRVK